jgi:hypothetical protein
MQLVSQRTTKSIDDALVATPAATKMSRTDDRANPHNGMSVGVTIVASTIGSSAAIRRNAA